MQIELFEAILAVSNYNEAIMIGLQTSFSQELVFSFNSYAKRKYGLSELRFVSYVARVGVLNMKFCHASYFFLLVWSTSSYLQKPSEHIQ